MAKHQFEDLIQRLRVVLVCNKDDQRPDAVLLEKYHEHHDNDAFTVLVARHSQAVWSVCLGLLRDSHDAEDVFQATFLRLARKAVAVGRGGSSVRGWLCRVASQAAIDVRRANGRRAKLQQRINAELPTSEHEPDRSKIWDVVMEELTKLPSRYREPLEHSLLRGQSSREAASELGCSYAAVQRRIGRGQQLLRERLKGRGVELTAGSAMLTSLVVAKPLSATPPLDLLAKTAETAIRYGAGETVPGIAVGLSENAGFASKVKLLLIAVMVVGAGSAVWAMLPRPQAAPAAPGLADAQAAPGSADAQAAAPVEKGAERETTAKAAAEEMIQIAGVVEDLKGNRVRNAAVALCGQNPFEATERGHVQKVLARTQTDGSGNFSADTRRTGSAWDFKECSVRVFVAAPGYAPSGLMVLEPRPLDEGPFRFELRSPDLIRGSVRDPNGKPVEGATVFVSEIGAVSFEAVPLTPRASLPPLWPEPVKTAADGSFELPGLNLKHGVSLLVSDDRHADRRVKLDEKVWKDKAGVIQLPPTIVVQARVTAADTQEPLPARVVFQAAGSRVDAFGDATGDLSVRLVAGETYHVFALAPEGTAYLSVDRLLALRGLKGPQKLQFALPRGISVAGRVVDQDSGKPIPRVRVQYLPDRAKLAELPSGLSAGICDSAISGDDGSFQLALPNVAGRLLVHESSGNYVTENGGFLDEGRIGNRIWANRVMRVESVAELARREIKVTLRRGAPIPVEVHGPDGAPVAKGVWLCQNLTVPRELSRVQLQPFLRGRFTFLGCEADRIYPVTLFDAENHCGALVDLRINPSGEPAKLKLERCGEAVVRFRDEAGQPVAKFAPSLYAMVHPIRSSDPIDKPELWADFVRANMFESLNQTKLTEPRSDEQGIVKFTSLIPRVRYRIYGFQRDGQPAAIDFVVSAGQTVTLPDLTIMRPR